MRMRIENVDSYYFLFYPTVIFFILIQLSIHYPKLSGKGIIQIHKTSDYWIN